MKKFLKKLDNIAKDTNVFVTDYSDLIKNKICPHCRCLIEDLIMTHIKNCNLLSKDGMENTKLLNYAIDFYIIIILVNN